MEVILRQHVDNLGDRGQIVKVADAGRYRIAEARAGERGIKLLVPEGEPVPEKKVHLAFDPVHAYLYEDGWLAGDRP